MSGSFKAIIGSAVKFGLLTSKREFLTTTNLFRRIKHAYDKQVWAAGRAVPIWHLPSTRLFLKKGAGFTGPVAVFSAAPLKSRLPQPWRAAGYGITQVDSFYLGGKKESGYWVVGILNQAKHKVP